MHGRIVSLCVSDILSVVFDTHGVSLYRLGLEDRELEGVTSISMKLVSVIFSMNPIL